MNYTKGEWGTVEITGKQGLRMSGGYHFGLWANTQTPSSIRAVSIAFVKQEQDAHLMAAAPDMFKVLKEMLSDWENGKWHTFEDYKNSVKTILLDITKEG